MVEIIHKSIPYHVLIVSYWSSYGQILDDFYFYN